MGTAIADISNEKRDCSTFWIRHGDFGSCVLCVSCIRINQRFHLRRGYKLRIHFCILQCPQLRRRYLIRELAQDDVGACQGEDRRSIWGVCFATPPEDPLCFIILGSCIGEPPVSGIGTPCDYSRANLGQAPAANRYCAVDALKFDCGHLDSTLMR